MTTIEQAVEPSSGFLSSFHADADPDHLSTADALFRAQRVSLLRELGLVAERILGASRSASIHAVHAWSQGDPDQRDRAIEDPAVAIWMQRLARSAERNDVDAVAWLIDEFPRLMARVDRRWSGLGVPQVPGTLIAVQRFDLDDFIKAAAPPSYFFPEVAPSVVGSHSTSFIADVLGVVFQTIQRSWPAEYEEICRLVKVIAYLPDATFRSCSAARYSGVVFLGSTDDSLLDVEESLVHEAGHQRLYRLAELSPILEPDVPRTADYTLPWSGAKRDLFGYFHAYYIYVALVKYFDRRQELSDHHTEVARRNRELIHRGLQIATLDLMRAKGFTQWGSRLLEALVGDVLALG